MSSQPKKLTWNANQVKILEMLKAGTSSHHHISEVLGINISVVTKVSNAIKQGQSPATPYVPKAKKKSAHSTSKWGVSPSYPEQNQTETVDEEDFQGGTNATSKTGSGGQVVGQTAAPNYAYENATVAQLYHGSVSIPITPIMVSARDYVTQRLHWSPTVRWEDLIDTVFYHYFKSRTPSVILQGWIEVEDSDCSSKPGTGNSKDNAGGGNGARGIALDDSNEKELTEAITQEVIKKMPTQQYLIGHYPSLIGHYSS